VSLLAIQVALNAVFDIRVLFLIGRRASDAATMARLFFLPAWVWATIWMLTSVALLLTTVWFTRRKSRTSLI
jgi:peptidase M50B-like protein